MSLTREGCLARRARLWQSVPGDVEWLLVADPRHVHYLCNFWVNPLSFSYGERGLLLLERSGVATLLADNFTIRSAATTPYVDQSLAQPWYDHRHSVENRDDSLFEALRSSASRLRGRLGLLEAEWLPVAAAAALEEAGVNLPATHAAPGAVHLGTLLRQLRRQKHADELDLLRQAMRATEAGHARAREVVRPGVSELDVFREVQSAVVGAAGRAVLIYGDFRGMNAQLPKAGGLPTAYQLQAGDLFLLDYSVMIDGYRSDFTNAISVGPPTPQQEELLAVCQAGMAAGEQALRAGAPAREVHASVAGAMRYSPHGATFTHHAGHGIGLAHPEPPILVPESTDVLLAGDVLTLEPGVYVPGIGGVRIEHNYLITDDGYERLSGHVIALG